MSSDEDDDEEEDDAYILDDDGNAEYVNRLFPTLKARTP